MVKEIHIATKAGDPSTLWQNTDSGKYYRTKAEAEADSGTEINPADFEIKKTFWQKHGKKVIAIAVVVVICVVVVSVLRPQKIMSVLPVK
jgi:hypothetical protein